MKTKMRVLAGVAGVAVVTLMASAAFASEEGVCDPETQQCGPSGPPQKPNFPLASDVGGRYAVNIDTLQQGDVERGTYQNGTYTVFGDSFQSHPTDANGSVTRGQPNNTITLQATDNPTPTISVTALSQMAQDPNFPGLANTATGSLTYSYIVDLHANTATAAAALSSLLNTSGAIATIGGAWSLTGTDSAYGAVSASTGTNELDYTLASGFYQSCSMNVGGYGGNVGGCGSGSYGADLNFVSASVYQNGNPYDFISQITLSVSAHSGQATSSDGYEIGSMTAMIDPTINWNISLADYSVTVGSYGPNAILPDTGGVPEPATWAMMLVGFGGLGSLLRRRRRMASATALAAA